MNSRVGPLMKGWIYEVEQQQNQTSRQCRNKSFALSGFTKVHTIITDVGTISRLGVAFVTAAA